MRSQPLIDIESLPDDVALLKTILLERDQTIAQLAAQLESLHQQFLALRRAHFGVKSEQLAGQAELFAEPVSLPVPPVATETITYERERRGRPVLPKDLPRVRLVTDRHKGAGDDRRNGASSG